MKPKSAAQIEKRLTVARKQMYQRLRKTIAKHGLKKGGSTIGYGKNSRSAMAVRSLMERRSEPEMKATRSPYDLNGLKEFPGD